MPEKNKKFYGKIEAKGELYLYEEFWDRLKRSFLTPRVYKRLREILGKSRRA